MHDSIEQETLIKAHKPYDVVSDTSGNVGFICEVNVNTCQEGFDAQISYAVEWLVGEGDKHAWYTHNELTYHDNLLIRIAEISCHPSGRSKKWVRPLMNNNTKR